MILKSLIRTFFLNLSLDTFFDKLYRNLHLLEPEISVGHFRRQEIRKFVSKYYPRYLDYVTAHHGGDVYFESFLAFLEDEHILLPDDRDSYLIYDIIEVLLHGETLGEDPEDTLERLFDEAEGISDEDLDEEDDFDPEFDDD